MKIRAIPFGYKYDVGQIVVDETAACVVKEIFKQYINGNSLLNISSLLNNMNIEYRPGVVGWNKARIKRIIEDKRYLGKKAFQVPLVKGSGRTALYALFSPTKDIKAI